MIDLRAFTHPLDMQQPLAYLVYTRNYTFAASLSALGPAETAPGLEVADRDLVGLEKYVRGGWVSDEFLRAGRV